MEPRHTLVAAIAALLWFSLAALGDGAVAADCVDTDWLETSEGISTRRICLAEGGEMVEVVAAAIDLGTTKLTLSGTGAGGVLPTVDDLVSVDRESFTLRGYLRTEMPGDLIVTAGYPQSSTSFLVDGLVRLDGVDLVERDTAADFKSAMLCLSELAGVRGDGSVPVVFNAFEDGSPIELNPRVLDNRSCRDVIQVGPRIIEYRGKKGITTQAERRTPQRYVAFAVGGGPAYRGYIITVVGRVTLFGLQRMLIDIDEWSRFDDETVVAVTIAAGDYGGMAIKDTSQSAGVLGEQVGSFVVVGAGDARVSAVMVANTARQGD